MVICLQKERKITHSQIIRKTENKKVDKKMEKGGQKVDKVEKKVDKRWTRWTSLKKRWTKGGQG